MTPVWDIAPHRSSFREHDIHPFPEGMTPPARPLVPAQVQQWVDDVSATSERVGRGEIHRWLREELARLHNQFERVHPFIDGYGRTGRLVMNLALVRLGYPPVIIFKRQRSAYLTAMQRADGGEARALGELIARAMYDNLNKFIVPNVAGPARMVPLAALADEELTVIALRRAAQRGRLGAMQGPDGIWRSSRRAVDAYRVARHQWRTESNTAPCE
jgi:hypothetical protein